jgi:hypothetical protein
MDDGRLIWVFIEKQLHRLTQIRQHQTLQILQKIGVSIKTCTDIQVEMKQQA